MIDFISTNPLRLTWVSSYDRTGMYDTINQLNAL